MPNSDDSTDRWSIVEIDVDVSVAEVLADELWSRGVAAIEEMDGPAFGLVTLRTSLGDDPHDVLAEVCARHVVEGSRVVRIARTVTEAWRAFAEPTWIDGATVLVPAWLDPVPGATNVRIEPGDQFGLGNHPTTILAARLLLGIVDESAVLADVGCGTGVLAIVAAMRTGCRALVHDIAPGARAIVERNREMNGLEAGSVQWFEGISRLEEGAASIVVANILAPVLRELSAEIRRVVARDGKVVLSGLREDQVGEMIEWYSPCVVEETRTLDGWAAVTLSL